MNIFSKFKKYVRDRLNRYLERYLPKFLERYLPNYLDAYLRKFLLYNHLVFGDPGRLHLAETAVVNNALFNVASGEINVADHVFFGHNVSLLTGSHDYKQFGSARQVAIPQTGFDIHVEEGAWVASNATILGPCKIGKNAVVAACSLVNSDIPENAIAAGIPAKIIGMIGEW